MKKVILGLAILMATSISPISAKDNSTQNKTCSNTECAQKGPQCGQRNKSCKAFEGIELTAEQKTKIAELRKNCKENEVKNCEKKDKGDFKNMTEEQKKQFKAEMKAKRLEGKKKYLENLKSILTPAQYNKFLENHFLFGHKDSKMKKAGKGGHDRKMAKEGNLHHKYDKSRKGGKNSKSHRA